MPRVSEEHRAAQRDRIQQAAIAVVRSKGLAAMTMGDIIRTSGLSAGAIYGYYRSKDELVVDVARSVMIGRRDLLESLAVSRPVPAPAQALSALLRSVPQEWLDGGLMLQFWGVATTTNGVFEVARNLGTVMLDAMREYLVTWLRQEGHGQPEEGADTLALAMLGLAQGYILQASIGIQVDVERYVAAVEQALGGVLAGS